jgi:hypothetical protein
MARYIDADKIDYKFIMVGQDEYAGYRAIAFESDIDELPTADVVPKSEYDAVVSAVDNSTKEFLRLHDEYQKLIEKNSKLHSQMAIYQLELHHSKKAVAREIFEDIENIAILNDYISVKDFYTNHPLVAELKKKYTEDKE